MLVKKTGSLEKALADLSRIHGTAVTAGLQGRAQLAANGEATAGELVEIGRAHEYGIGVPMRPFMRTSVAVNGLGWVVGWDRAVRAATDGEFAKMTDALRVTGVIMVGSIQATIVDGDWTPNSAATIGRKGSDKPLIDTGQMRQSIRAQVEVRGSAPVVVS